MNQQQWQQTPQLYQQQLQARQDALRRMPPSAPPSRQPQSMPDQRASPVDPFREFEAKIASALDKMHNQTRARLNMVEIAIGNLAKITTEALQVGSVTQKENKDGFDRLQAITLQSSRSLHSKVDKVERILGDPDAADPDKTHTTTVLGRVQLLERAILELTESINDPDAPYPPISKRDLATVTSPLLQPTADTDIRVLVDAAVDATSEPPRRSSTASQTVYSPSHEDTQEPVRFPPYTFPPLAPAQWTPQWDEIDISVSVTPSPSIPPVSLPKHSSPPAEDVPIHQTSSTVDEQEIADRLGKHLSSASSTPPPLVTPPSAQILSIARPPSPCRSALDLPLPSSSPSTPRPVVVPITTSMSENGAVHRPLPRGFRRGAPGTLSVSPLYSITTDTSSARSPHSQDKEKASHPRARSGSLSSMSSLTSIATSHPPFSHAYKQRPSYRKDWDDAFSDSGSNAVRMKADLANNLSHDRPAKRRKTFAHGDHFEYEPVGMRGQGTSNRSFAARGRDKGKAVVRNDNGVAPTQRRRNSVQLLITPIVDMPPAAKSAPAGTSASQSQTSAVAAGKTRYEIPKIGTDCEWPAKISGGDEGSRREFVQCDNCEGWYHFGCVGLTVGDPRLEPDAEFVCPPCQSSRAAFLQRRTVRYRAAACLRPDCDHPGAAEDSNEYFVERIIGRRPFKREIDTDVKEPTKFMWLVKWDGYKTDQATWAADEHLGECSRIIEEFELAAEIEGRDLSVSSRTILLNEAKAAGWI